MKTIYSKILTASIAICILPTLLSADNTPVNTNPKLQQQIESILSESQTLYEADEIMAAVMESSTGKVIAMVSSNSSSNAKFSAYTYEPGSVMKPITLALALEHNATTPETWFDTYGGRMKLEENRTIVDYEKFDSLTATDIVVHSSNIGIAQIGWKLTGKEFRDGLVKFGFSKPSGIDLGDDHPGRVKSIEKLNKKIHRANSSYGYGIHVTFAQLLKAYSAFNNNGVTVTPTLADKGKEVKELQVISQKTASQVHNILLEAVKRGTAVKAQYDGLQIGGKTGTAFMVKNEQYISEYHSSFYGFANDAKGHKYTIGVLVIRAKEKYKYFASQSAVPVFKKIVESMVLDGYLNPVKGFDVIEE